ncbi:glycoside hydrolase family 127 protein [Paenibacillus harenae]|uniref:DUF1680 family protein n=1 Tax=Paenibacillus harenae TaxID=306543 RepID=A0ABT9U3A5_PAEHA|nr:beta-L-arabinofuranosidase domain-containing protein [Paenibacillus harenae]MDQ0114126.1 DUF1680 family protein [Paenibacillus harenae]
MRDISLTSPIPLHHISIRDSFWSPYLALIRDVVVPYQWEALNDRIAGTEPSHAMKNYKIVAGLEQGDFYGMVFQDSDVAKWLEAASYLLALAPDAELETIADDVIAIIAKAQQADGYLNTYFTLKEPAGRWTNLAECHELYCAGHLIEAAVAYHDATGKSRILDVACRLADCIDETFGSEDGKIKGYDGHQEIELALVKLYRATGNDRYLRLAKFFLDERGRQPHFYDIEYALRDGRTHFPMLRMAKDKSYSQAHVPIREQQSAEGHAVRAVYMCTGMAAVAAETGDAELLAACRKLWESMVTRRMYITGALGSMAYGEAFSLDYDLPGDTAYAETCASIGLIFFAGRMLQIEARGEYADVLERALYNTVIGGMSRDGKHFFYVNPLEVWPEAIGKNANYDHVKIQRQPWFGCACCPPNIARLLASLGSYIYTHNDDCLYAHLYIGGEASVKLSGHDIRVIQRSEFPWEGSTRIEFQMEQPTTFTLALRIPGWAEKADVFINGIPYLLDDTETVDGYASIRREWNTGDSVQLVLPMSIKQMKGNPLIRDTAGKVALQRGPIVYCLEEADNGGQLHQLYIPENSSGFSSHHPELLDGISMIEMPALRLNGDQWGNQLYSARVKEQLERTTARFIPYYAWANRGIGEMRVWVNQQRIYPEEAMR